MCTRMSGHPQWLDTIAMAGTSGDTRWAAVKLCVPVRLCSSARTQRMWKKPRQNRQARHASLPQNGTKAAC